MSSGRAENFSLPRTRPASFVDDLYFRTEAFDVSVDVATNHQVQKIVAVKADRLVAINRGQCQSP